MIDLFALCIAALLDNDTDIVTPKHRALAMQTARSFAQRWTVSLRDQRPDGAPSFLAYLLEQDRLERARDAADLEGSTPH